MKCDELESLKHIEVAYNITTGKEQAIAEYSDGTCHGFDECEEVYLKADVDEAIAELKAKLESVQASMYCDVVDANMENRRLKRSLWMARAERAKAMSVYWYIKRTEISNWEEFNSKWNKIENLCRAKAEEYK